MTQQPRIDPSLRASTHILVVEDDDAMRDLLLEELQDAGFQVATCSGGRSGLARVSEGDVDVVVTDLRMPDLDGLDLLRDLRAAPSSPHVILVTAFGSIETAKKALKLGAYDYITKPFEIEELLVAVENAIADRGLRKEVAQLRKQVESRYSFDNIIGPSDAMQEVFDLITRLEGKTASVLITGESGTGKEVVARAIHTHSPRRGKAFVAVNLAAIPDTLLESELFGYKRGAFTDAHADRKGLFAEADGGTIFLDEIGELSPSLQAKLLRVLQEMEVRPLGSTRNEKIDVRVLAATNRDLDTRMRDGQFREDLYYRLNVIQITLPTLAERPEDIVPLADFFLKKLIKKSEVRANRIGQSAIKAMLVYRWPGNVRELQNAIERAVALCDGEEITLEDLPPQIRERRPPDLLAGALARGLPLAELEREYIEKVLVAEGGNKTRAANRLGLDRKTLYRKLEEYARLSGAKPPIKKTPPAGMPATSGRRK